MSKPPLYQAALERGTIEPDRGGAWVGPVEHGAALRRGLYTFLAPLTSMFVLLLTAYMFRRQYADWQALALPAQLWLSTALLIASSAAMEWARRGAAAVDKRQVAAGLLGAGLLAVAFLGSQYWAWQALQQAGHFIASNPANSFVYLLTGLHAAHLAGGLVAWLKTRSALARGEGPQTVSTYVQLLAIYWHFLLAVWLVVFAVLLLRG